MSLKPIVLLLVLCAASSLRAEDELAETVLPLEGVNELTIDLADVVIALGRSDLDEATFRLGKLSPRGNPEQDESARRVLQPFGSAAAEFRTVDLVAAERLSSRACSLCLVGNGKAGPVLFVFNAYRPDRDWVVMGVSFQSNWPLIASTTRSGRFEKPLTIRTAQRPPAEARESDSAGDKIGVVPGATGTR